MIDIDFENAKKLLDKGMYMDAIVEFKNVKEDSEKYMDAVYLRAFSFAKLRHFRNALQGFKQLLKEQYQGYENEYAYFMYNIGVCYYRTYEFKKAYLFLKYASACNSRLEIMPKILMLEKIIFRNIKNTEN